MDNNINPIEENPNPLQENAEEAAQDTPPAAGVGYYAQPLPLAPVMPQNTYAVQAAAKQKSPKATWSLVCGIAGLLSCWCLYGIPGMILSITSMVLGGKAYKENRHSPTAMAGMIVGFLGMALSAVIMFALIGLLLSALGIEYRSYTS
ncbi:MAG: DUF4190 domain-containing protein [Oscillospiraceae bacterium]|nr:DUF4190 domain-containing protein [Oscillospiraceae bacterium]